ncbi:MAG: hypothetical protein E7343_05610 [Clostridiales bacterium]|nr:hypothetical protein [Clostridiales bacterium]
MKGKLSIVTQIDGGEETFTTFDGEMSFSPLNASVHYNDGESFVKIVLDSQKMTIERLGDYGFFLELKENESTKAQLNVVGSVGDLTAYTEYLRYSIKEKSLLLSVKYFLVFAGGERQEMKIRLTARLNGSEES